MSSTDEIAGAFSTVDELLLAAAAAAPALELLLARAAEQGGITETKLANHLGLNAAVVKWVLNLAPDATTDRSIDLDDADLGEVLLRWARS